MAEPRRTARPRSRRGEGGALRQELLRAAMDLLAETGDEEAVSVRAVAARVGVSVPSVYLHFADKQALLDAVCAEVFAQLHVRLVAATEGADEPLEALRRQGVAYVRFALENPEHYRVVLMRKHPLGGGAADAQMAGGAFEHLLAGVQACIDAGWFAGDAVDLALRLWASAHGVAALLVAKPYFPWPPLDEFVDATIRTAGLGLVLASRVGPGADPAALLASLPPLPPAAGAAPRKRRVRAARS